MVNWFDWLVDWLIDWLIDCRHVAVSPQSVETTDKFRIHMFEEGTSEVSEVFSFETE